jgi:hypothetical protein
VPVVIVKMIVEKQMEYRLTGETEILGENLPQRHFLLSFTSIQQRLDKNFYEKITLKLKPSDVSELLPDCSVSHQRRQYFS